MENNIGKIIEALPGISRKIAEKGFVRYTLASIRKSFNISDDTNDEMVEKQFNDILNEKGIIVHIEKENKAISFKPIEGLFKIIPESIKPPVPIKPSVETKKPIIKDVGKMWEDDCLKIPKDANSGNTTSSYETLFQNELSTQKLKLKEFIGSIDSPEKIYELFRKLNYPKDKILDISIRNINDFDFAKDEKEKIKNVYTILNYDKDMSIFFVETKSMSNQLIRYITNVFDRRYNRFMLIFTVDYSDIAFIFPDRKIFEEGKHKLKITKLMLKRDDLYNYTDIETISSIILSGNEKTYRDIFIKWREAFKVERITDNFFKDYKEIFLTIRRRLTTQRIETKNAHEYTLQFLNRIMLIYFISKKRWLGNEPKFMKWFWDRYRQEKAKGAIKENTFYQNWLKTIFFEAFNNEFTEKKELQEDVNKVLLDAPYLNGGLFKKNKLDELNIDIDDKLFEGILNFLEKYNFTVKEDMPLDAEVAVDPQMIGYIYESLANVGDNAYGSENDMRNAWGIFYTPKVEVDFMARRSLVEYLAKNLLNVQKEKLYQLVFDDKGTDEFIKVAEYFEKEKLWPDLERVLDSLLVIDPACGSGAFLVGMLNVLMELYRTICKYQKKDMRDFDIKKRIIGQSLYGVDVMSWAIGAAELRLWLQLIVDANFDSKDLKKAPLLPNLNMNLRIGDSIVQEIGGINLHVRDSNLSEQMKERSRFLKEEKEKYFNNDSKYGKDELIKEGIMLFVEIVKERIGILENSVATKQTTIFGNIINDKSRETQKRRHDLSKLKEILLNISDPEKRPFIWDVDFAEVFGEKGGFDIVIGNPPYVKHADISPSNKTKENITNEDKKEYKEKLIGSVRTHFQVIESLDKKSDYYIYFYFTGLSILNEKGTFCFITSNSWLDAGFGKDLQKFLLKYVPIYAIYDSNKRVFEHAAVNTVITLFGAPNMGIKKSVYDLWR